jgi:tetratricopeptide (TPR) repeat protein
VSTSQLWLLALLGLVLASAMVIALAVLRHAPRSRAAEYLGRGAFAEALRSGRSRPEAWLAAAIAARHLLEFETASELLDRALPEDAHDGEALVERGLVEAYAGRHDQAVAFLKRAAASRADLTESITLHRAWLELRRGRTREARHRFEEIEASLESKLRADLAGDPLFAEWFLHAALLWRAAGDEERASWAWREGLAAAPESRLFEVLGGQDDARPIEPAAAARRDSMHLNRSDP